MRTGPAIAVSLAAAMALPGCGGAGVGAPRRAGVVLRNAPRSDGNAAARPPDPPRAQPARTPAPGRTADAVRAPALNGERHRRGARAGIPAPLRRAAPGRPAVPPSPLLRAFQILRRPERSGDRPAGQARALLSAEAREDRREGEGSPVIAAARRLPAAPGVRPSWIVPAGERVCLLRAVPGGPTAPETIECVRAAAAARGYLMSAITGLPGNGERSSLLGVLPAGARDASLELADGAWVALALREGAYAASGAGARTIRFQLSGRELTVPVPHRPSAPQR